MAAVFAPITAANLALGYRLYRLDRNVRRVASRFGLKKRYKALKKKAFGYIGAAAAGYFGSKMSTTIDYGSPFIRKRRASGSNVTVDAGATNVVQRSYHRSKSGKRPKQNAKLALRLLKSTQSYAVLRFQRLSNYEGTYDASVDIGRISADNQLLTKNRPMPLIHGRIADTTIYTMPVQMFDLTSISSSPENAFSSDAACAYTLFYDNATGNYFWRNPYCKGPKDQADNYSQTHHWWTERSPSGTTVASRPQITKSAFCTWVDLRMILYGATAETTRFTVMTCQIKDQFYDPNQYLNSTEKTGVEGERQSTHNQFWNTLLKTRVYNPIASAGVKTEGLFKILSTKTYVVGPDTTSNLDVHQPNVICKKFINMNRVQKFDWFKTDKPINAQPTAPNVIDTNNELDDDDYNQYMLNATKSNLHPKARVFLLVYADCFNEASYPAAVVAGDGDLQGTFYTGLPGGVNPGSLNPCMDIVIRKKLIYDDT